MAEEYKNNGVIGWDDVIEDDGQEYVTLDEGDYLFYVEKWERRQFNGSKKIPPAPMARLTLVVTLPGGREVPVNTNLIMHKVTEFKLSSFFRCIGQKKHGEQLKMDWNKVPMSWGRCHIKPRTYTGTDGQEYTTNDVDKFYDYDDKLIMEARKALQNESGDEYNNF